MCFCSDRQLKAACTFHLLEKAWLRQGARWPAFVDRQFGPICVSGDEATYLLETTPREVDRWGR